MPLSQEELDQIKEVIAHQLNGALDAKLDPIKEDIKNVKDDLKKGFSEMDARFTILDDKIGALEKVYKDLADETANR